MENKPESTGKTIWKATTWFERALIFSIIAYLLYLNSSTELILNFNEGNETRYIMGGVANLPNTVAFPPNSYVPKSNVSNTLTAIGIFLYCIAIYIILARKLAMKRRATMPEALEDTKLWIKNLKTIPTLEGSQIPLEGLNISVEPIFMTRYDKTTSQEGNEFRYVFLVTVKDEYEETIRYYHSWYHPWTRYWDGFFPVKRELSRIDRCPRCGNEHDIAYLESEDIRKIKELKGRGIITS